MYDDHQPPVRRSAYLSPEQARPTRLRRSRPPPPTRARGGRLMKSHGQPAAFHGDRQLFSFLLMSFISLRPEKTAS